MENKNAFLEKFGKDLIEQVRDQSFQSFLRIMSGDTNSPRVKKLHNLLVNSDGEQSELLKTLALNLIDSTMHYFLFLIQQGDAGDEGIDLVQRTSNGSFSLRDFSDGLCGELYTEEGWIERFSKYPPTIE